MLPLYLQDVFLQYQAACMAEGLRDASYESFCRLWRKNLAHTVVMKPMIGLCTVCQKNSTAIMRTANLPVEEKSEVCHVHTCGLLFTSCAYQVHKQAQRHLDQAMEARSYMKAQVDASKSEVTRAFPSGLPPLHCSLVPACNDMCMLYSFDFAQQVCHTHTYSILINAQVHYSHTCRILINAQVHYPHNPQQPGPIYFLTSWKCGLFGVCCEAVPRQVS